MVNWLDRKYQALVGTPNFHNVYDERRSFTLSVRVGY